MNKVFTQIKTCFSLGLPSLPGNLEQMVHNNMSFCAWEWNNGAVVGFMLKNICTKKPFRTNYYEAKSSERKQDILKIKPVACL